MVEVNRMTTPANMRWKLVDRETGAENAAIDWRFRVGDQVKIRLVNEMDADHPMHHPFHVHGAGRFLVLARDGVVEPNLVWKDTVLVRTGETVDILLDVTNPGLWMAHCHIAEHHESGMMFSFNVARREVACRPTASHRRRHRTEGPMSQPRPTDPIGSIGWTERTGGVLTARECLTLARPLLRGELSILAGRLAMVLRMHSGRRSSIDPASLVPPDSPLARDAEVAAQDLLTPALLNHSSRAYTWGAAIAALHGITFDRELLYLAAMFHDTGIPSPVPDVDFTVRSAALAREFTDSHHVPADIRELVANAIAMHYTPGVGLESGAEAYLLSAGAAVDVFGLRSNEIPDAVRQSVIQEYPRLGFKREFAGLLRAEAKQVPRGRAWYLHRFAVSDLSIRLAPFRD